MKVALLQYSPKSNRVQENLRYGLKLIETANSKYSPDLVLFPEMWSNGFTEYPINEDERKRWRKEAVTKDSEYFTQFQDIAKKLSLNIAITYLGKTQRENLHNSVSIINTQGDVVLDYSKVNICDFGIEELLKEESERKELGCDIFLTEGDSFPVCELETSSGKIKVGAMICADREMPEVSIELFKNGAEIIVIPNACTWEPLRNCQLQSRAFEILGGIALANYPSPKCNGQSCAFDPIVWNHNGSYRNNQILKTNEEEGIFLAEFDINAIRKFREAERWRIENKLKFARKQKQKSLNN